VDDADDRRPVARTPSTAASKAATSNQSRTPFPERLLGIGQGAGVVLDLDRVELEEDLAVAHDCSSSSPP
jgi:hypothetical protein